MRYGPADCLPPYVGKRNDTEVVMERLTADQYRAGLVTAERAKIGEIEKRLTALGLTSEQIERHVRPLRQMTRLLDPKPVKVRSDVKSKGNGKTRRELDRYDPHDQ
jgi:hypothetical protein